MMKTIWPGVLVFAGCMSLGAVSPSAAMENHLSSVRIEGRTATGADGRIRMGFPGIALHLRCRGSAVAMTVEASNDNAFFDVIVDSLAPVRLRAHAGPGTYPLLPAGTSAGEHVIEVVRRNESWQGTVDLLRVEPDAGTELLAPPPAPPRRLMFIGDSVTGGEIAAYDSHDPLTGKLAHNEQAANARISYGFLLARQLGAECHLVSYGGRGIIRDWQGIRDTANAPQFYERALPDDARTRWNPAQYVPDAIGVALGTNDFNQGVPDQNEFVNAYVEFIRKLRRDAPRAYIFLLESPILVNAEGQPPKRSVLRGYLEQIIVRVDDPRVQLAPVAHYPGLPGNGHPVASEHAAMAVALKPLFQRALGW